MVFRRCRVRVPGGLRARLAFASDPHGGAAFAGRLCRRAGSHPRGTALEPPGVQRFRREPARRRRHYRRRLRGEKRAGWLHPAIHRDAPRHQRLDLQEAAVRSAQGLRAGGAGRLGTLRPGGQSAAPGPFDTRAHRRGKSAAVEDRLCELGVPGYQATLWLNLAAAAGAPGEIVQRNYAETAKALQDAELQQSFRAAGVEASPMSPQELAGFMRGEYEKWGRVVRDTGATVN